MGAELGNEGLGEARLVQVDDVLNHVVAKGVLDQAVRIVGDALDEPGLLLAVGMINAPLEDAATVTVSAHVDAVLPDSVEDEVRLLGAELVEALLNHVVAIQILDQRDDLHLQGVGDHLNLNLVGHMFDHLLKGASTVLVQRDRHHVFG